MNPPLLDRRNIGIFAHVDAGKTTLTERLLTHSGAVRAFGAVDDGAAHTDRLDIERRRGISIRSTAATLCWQGVTVDLIDTPGHADFASEVERSLWALDGAVLVLDAVEGVQPQTEILFEAFARRRLPVIVFINKTDRPGADVPGVIAKARQLLSPSLVDPSNAEDLQWLLAESDEAALSDLLAGTLYPLSELRVHLQRLSHQGLAFPVLWGSALRDEGIPALLDAILSYLPPPQGDAKQPLCGVVFAVEQGEGALGRAAHVRLFSGTLQNRDSVPLPLPPSPLREPRQHTEKVTQIRSIPLEGRGVDLGVLRAGEIGAVYGLGEIRVGQVLGEASLLPHSVRPGEIAAPLLMVKVVAEDAAQKNELRQALATLSAEDPLLSAEQLGGEMHIRLMGAIQLEVLREQIPARFGVSVRFEEPTVIYRETIARSAVGFWAYTMPKPCWAVIKFQIDPLPRGSGVVYQSQVPAREILPRYQHQIQQAIPLALRQGMLGWQVDDVKITLIGGEHHLVHTHPLDFIVATPVAFLDGLRRGGSLLLEPILDMRIITPEEAAGKVISEIVAMRGEVLESQGRSGMLTLKAQVPLATSVHFAQRLSALTSGRGALSMALSGYREVDRALGAECPRRGVHPLDTAKYILAARSALEGGIFDL